MRRALCGCALFVAPALGAVPTTISAIDISDDTGISDTDFITATASQTITANLSAELAEGEILYGSVDAGATYTDITDQVTGTAISWEGATLSGSSSIKLKVTTSGVVAEQPYLWSDAYVSSVTSSMDVNIQGWLNNVLNVTFISNTAIAAGHKIYISLPDFGAGIVATPTVTGINVTPSGTTYNAASEVLEITVAAGAGEGNTITVNIPIAQSPATGNYIVGVSHLGSSVTLAPPIVFGPTLNSINASITPDTAGATNTNIAFSVACSHPIPSGDTLSISLPGFGAGIVASPSLTNTTVTFSGATYDAATEVLLLTLGASIDANHVIAASIPVAQNPAIGTYNLGLSYQGRLETADLYVNPVFSASTSIDSTIPAASSILTVSFSVDALITAGTSIGIDLPGFGTGLVASPAISLLSGWGASGYNDVAYDSSNEQLTWTLTTADIPANTLVSVDIPIAANPPAGSYNLGVLDNGRMMPAAAPLLFIDTVSSVSASMNSPIAGASNTELTVSFRTSSTIVPNTTVTIGLLPIGDATPFGTGIVANPTAQTVSGWGSVTLTGAVYDSAAKRLTVTAAGAGSVPANTLVTMKIPVAQNPPTGGSLDVVVGYGGITGQAASPLVFIHTISSVSSSLSSAMAEASNTTLVMSFSTNLLISAGETITIVLPGFGTAITATPVISPISDWGIVTVASAAYTSSTGTLVVTLGGSGTVPANTLVSMSIPVAQNPAAGSYDPVVTYGGQSGQAATPLLIHPLFSASTSIDSNTTGAVDSVMTVSFSIDTPITIGSSIGLDLTGFGTAIVANPAISLTSGWGPAGFSSVAYNAATSQLTWTVTNFSIPANTPLTVEIPVAQNPAVGSYSVRVLYAGYNMPAAAPLVFIHSLSSVSGSINSPMASASNTLLTVSFRTSAPIVPYTSFSINLLPIDGATPFGTGILNNPAVQRVSGWGSVTLTGAVYSSAASKLTVNLGGTGSVPANTLVTMTIPVAQNPPPGSYDLQVTYDGITGQAASPLVVNNNLPSFISPGSGDLTVGENAPPRDIAHLLQVSDIDISQTKTWSQISAPSHGTLTITNASASSGSTEIAPPSGSITYTPTPNYVGTDSFSIQVSDGMNTATRVINVSSATVIGDISSNTPGGANSILAVSFSSDSTIPIGTVVTVTLPGFGAAIATTPAISPGSGWGPVGFNTIGYNAATSTLTWTVTSVSIPANTLLTVNIPVTQNPPVGSYNWGVKLSTDGVYMPAASPLVYHHPLRVRGLLSGNSPDTFVYTIDGAIDQVIDVETSEDLVNWSPLETITLSNGTATFSDPDATDHPSRFYRLK